MIISEQLVVYGNVDFPPTDKNMIPVISLLTPMGYMPNTVQEVSSDGSATFRMALNNMKDSQVIFGVDKIQISRSIPFQTSDTPEFLEFALEILEKINTVRPVSLTRIGVIKDKFLPELSGQEMDDIFIRLYGATEEVPFEWNFRTTVRCAIDGENDILITDIGRGQGTINDNGRMSEFDRFRLKVDTGTDIGNIAPRFDFLRLRVVAEQLFNKASEQERVIEGRLYG